MFSPTPPGLRLQHFQDAVQLGAEVVALGGLFHHLVLRGCGLRRLFGGYSVQRGGRGLDQAIHLLGLGILCRQAEGGQDAVNQFVHTVSSFLRLVGGVFYCNRGPGPSLGHNSHVIASDMSLPVPRPGGS